MCSIIQQIYDNNYDPRPESHSEEFQNVSFKVIQQQDALEALLNAEQWSTYLKLAETQNERLTLENDEAFAHGFRLGIRLMMEVFCD